MEVVPCHGYVEQGDIFAAVDLPFLDPSTGVLEWESRLKPAMVLSHGCTLDKRAGNSTEPRVTSLQFLPLRPIAELDPVIDQNRRALLRADELEPAEVFWIGTAEDGIEYFTQLSDAVSVPATAFAIHLHQFTKGDWRLVAPTVPRLGRVPEQRLPLLWRKIATFWTRFDLSFPD